MQVLCKASNAASDVRCQVCGQGFLVYWSRCAPEARARCRADVMEALRAHHDADLSKVAHPQAGFNLPAWDGEPHVSAAALLGNAPAWATV